MATTARLLGIGGQPSGGAKRPAQPPCVVNNNRSPAPHLVHRVAQPAQLVHAGSRLQWKRMEGGLCWWSQWQAGAWLASHATTASKVL